MTQSRVLHAVVFAAGFAIAAAIWARPVAGQTVRIDSDDIGGVVTGPRGPEAGVWVIAETAELPTKFVRIVVTDDQGRFLLPDMPNARYSVWVRGYVPINTGNLSEALLALKDGEWVVLRVPYPLGFFTKWLDGRIDDPAAGWKGKGLWATVSTRAPFHKKEARVRQARS